MAFGKRLVLQGADDGAARDAEMAGDRQIDCDEEGVR
jgi:hypothetical protein